MLIDAVLSDNTGFCQFCTAISTDLAIQWNHERHEKVDVEIIASMNDKLEIPDSKVYSSEKYSIINDSGLVDLV